MSSSHGKREREREPGYRWSGRGTGETENADRAGGYISVRSAHLESRINTTIKHILISFQPLQNTSPASRHRNQNTHQSHHTMKLSALALLLTPVLSLTVRRRDGPATHKVLVGHTVREKSLAFYPPSVRAAVGDTVQFQFRPFNHTVTQAVGASAPCSPMDMQGMGAMAVAPVNSGFVPGAAEDAKEVPVFNMQVTSTDPMYLYCGQAPHCNLGMVMIINPKSDDDVMAFEAAAKAQDKTIPPAGAMAGGTMGTIPIGEAIVPP